MSSEITDNENRQPPSESPIRQAKQGEAKDTALTELDPNSVARINGLNPHKSNLKDKMNQASTTGKQVTISTPTIEEDDGKPAKLSQTEPDIANGEDVDEAGDDNIEAEATTSKKKKRKSKSKSKSKRGLVVPAHRLEVLG